MAKKKGVANADKDFIPHVIDSDVEEELVLGGETLPVPEKLERASKGKLISASKLSDRQLDEAADAIIMGRTISAVAKELDVDPKSLGSVIRERIKLNYQRVWQQSIRFDALRAEKILYEALSRVSESPKWGKLALEVLAYRARVLGFEKTTLQETSIRVAGLSKIELYQEAIKRL